MKNNIKQAREFKGLTQQECCDIFDVKIRAWQTYEQGISEPKYELLCRIADVFCVSTDYLLGRTTVKAMAKPAEGELTEEEITEIEKDIVSSYTALPVETRRACIQALTTVLGDVFDIEEQTENEPLTEDPEELAQ